MLEFLRGARCRAIFLTDTHFTTFQLLLPDYSCHGLA